jgi:hypothetical protein
MAWNPLRAIGDAIGRVFGRGETTPAPAPSPQERGLFERIRDRVTGAAWRREEAERGHWLEERQREIEERERQLEERELAESRDRERQATEARESVRPPAPPAPQLPETLRGIPPVMPLGPKGRDGAAYTTAASADIMSRLQEAASLGKRVSLRVHDENGWHDLFINPDGPGRHKAARGMSADYLVNQIGSDFDAWVDDGCETDEGGGYEDELGEADGYQLTMWS